MPRGTMERPRTPKEHRVAVLLPPRQARRANQKEDYPAVSYEESKEQFVKNPMVFEFLGIPQDAKIHEGKLESAIIDQFTSVAQRLLL